MVDAQRLLAALAYPFWIIAVILTIISEKKATKEEKHMRFHAYNALFFNIAMFVMYMLMRFSFMGRTLLPTLYIAFFILSVYYAIEAYHKEEVHIPIITEKLTSRYAKW